MSNSFCVHPQIWFNSGDYYVSCPACLARWGRLSNDGRPEYGMSDGIKIGCAPEEANNSPGFSDRSRVIATPQPAPSPAGAMELLELIERRDREFNLFNCPSGGHIRQELARLRSAPPVTVSEETVVVTGIHLFKINGCAVVSVEIDGKWVEVIRENAALAFSHIVEPSGIRKAALAPGGG